jgi:hypothetical protein
MKSFLLAVEAMWPNPSIERTSKGLCPCVASHVKRWPSIGDLREMNEFDTPATIPSAKIRQEKVQGTILML